MDTMARVGALRRRGLCAASCALALFAAGAAAQPKPDEDAQRAVALPHRR